MRQAARIGLILAIVVGAGAAQAGGLRFAATLSSAQAVPEPGPGEINGGNVTIAFDESFSQAHVRLAIDGAQNVVAAHFHCAGPGAPGPVAAGLIQPGNFVLMNGVAEGVLTNADVIGANCADVIGRPVENIVALAFAMREGLVYLNVHTTDNPPGEVRGQMLGRRGHGPGNGDGDDDDDDDDDRRHGHGHNLIGQLALDPSDSEPSRLGLNLN